MQEAPHVDSRDTEEKTQGEQEARALAPPTLVRNEPESLPSKTEGKQGQDGMPRRNTVALNSLRRVETQGPSSGSPSTIARACAHISGVQRAGS